MTIPKYLQKQYYMYIGSCQFVAAFMYNIMGITASYSILGQYLHYALNGWLIIILHVLTV